MNTGEAWGILRVFPKDVWDLNARDIPIFDELPLDLSVTAGAITYSSQNPGSHIYLKARERGTPDMVLRDKTAIESLRNQFDGKPIHLRVAEETYTIESTTLDKVESELRKKIPSNWITQESGSIREVRFYDEMCARGSPMADCLNIDLSRSFGGKAARLAFLTHPDVLGQTWAAAHGFNYPLVPDGFGIPTSFYPDFVTANPSLANLLKDFIAKEKNFELSSNQRRELLMKIRSAFYAGKIPDETWKSIVVALRKLEDRVFSASPSLDPQKGLKLKIRSSASAEDIPGFNGAGLHESYGAKLPYRRSKFIESLSVIQSLN